ncbi:sodium:alanine symporter family protein [Anaerococcus sp. NML200574]|uniref:Alanine/glycine:cation symporter family protein n=1 Tax=Anaerococcus kampingae TaxID=3115614 RepID=A0ABW9MEE6_9FIRM|nr:MULTISPECIES: sodium:alanine symporter family protein [unclassified Anaerococcus]MCW6678636.1 sodium:alanine symporter family protein [Anaerococcus sp. NML200574]MCW6700740.1 sodium:alanine symporter family protein [Anaerococcus sp. NML200537]
MNIFIDIANFMWANVIGYVLLGVGLYYSIRLGFPQFRYAKDIFHVIKKNLKSDSNVSGFAALATAVGGQVGTGSLVGVATALVAGGPGAIFWMWITALLGMIITFAETVLGQIYRVKLEDGTYRGGPAYYVRFGLKSRIMSVITAIFYIIGVGLCIAFMQTNSIAQALTGVSNINPIYIGVVITIIAAIVTIGGVKRLTDISSKIVPVMAGLYILAVLFILLTNITKVPAMFSDIFKGAFGLKQAFAGLGGYTVMTTFRYGVARGLFSNDAGNGIAGIMHASADVKHPAEQGFLGMFGTFVTTIIICTLTAFAIMLTGVLGNGNDGIVLVQDAFQSQLGNLGRWMIFFAMLMFGFTTLIADLFYGETNVLLIFKEKAKIPLWIYRLTAFAMFIISTKLDLHVVWGIIDVFVGIIVFINVISLFLLFKKVKEVMDDYERQKSQGIEDPLWKREEEYKL